MKNTPTITTTSTLSVPNLQHDKSFLSSNDPTSQSSIQSSPHSLTPHAPLVVWNVIEPALKSQTVEQPLEYKTTFSNHHYISEKDDEHTAHFQCSFSGCGKVFTKLTNLRRHERLHSGVKPFQCTIAVPDPTPTNPEEKTVCGKCFARRSDLRAHERTHTGEKPYICQCGRRFTRNSDWRSHERTHQNLKPFICGIPTCTKAFARKSDLKKHIKTHFRINLSGVPFVPNVNMPNVNVNIDNNTFIGVDSVKNGVATISGPMIQVPLTALSMLQNTAPINQPTNPTPCYPNFCFPSKPFQDIPNIQNINNSKDLISIIPPNNTYNDDNILKNNVNLNFLDYYNDQNFNGDTYDPYQTNPNDPFSSFGLDEWI